MVSDGHTKAELVALVKTERPYVAPTPKMIDSAQIMDQDPNEVAFMPLPLVRTEQGFRTMYRTECAVVGKQDRTLYAPRLVRVTCPTPCKKSSCALSPDGAKTFEMKKTDPDILTLMDATYRARNRAIAAKVGIPAACNINVEVVRPYDVNSVLVTDPITGTEVRSEPVQVPAYVFSSNINTGATYLMTGYSSDHPSDGTMVGVFTECQSVSSMVDSFRMTQPLRDSLLEFRIREDKDLWEGLMERYERLGESVTFIRGRPLLHMGVDLAIHSAVSFYFNKEHRRKCSIEMLVFGDRQVGKGLVAERLMSFYQTGEVINCENTSYMNLVGGIKISTGFRGIAWGRLALRTRDVVCLDESGELPVELIGRLSRVRSEGYAEIDKDGLHGRADARTAIIWIANPRDKRGMNEHRFGLDALSNLFPKLEDQTRFDYVLGAMVGEVPGEAINVERGLVPTPPVDREAAHNLVMWVKSRTENQIKFTQPATGAILRATMELADRYTSYRIGLVQGENFRWKLAKVAAAIAGATFSADSTGEVLVVDERCVHCAVQFYRTLYDSPVLGYKIYSDMVRHYTEVNASEVRALLEEMASHAGGLHRLVQALMYEEELAKGRTKKLLGGRLLEAVRLLDGLIELGCLTHGSRYSYKKTPQFTEILKELLSEGFEL